MPDFFVDKFKLKIVMLEDVMLSADVVEVVVDTNVFMPAMFTVIIQDDPDPYVGIMKYVDIDPRFKIGAPVSIGFETTDTYTGVIPISNTIIEGEITSIEPIFFDGRAQLRIRGYDRLHRLMRGKQTRAFQMMNDMMIISKIAGEVGMTPVVAGAPTSIEDYVLQYNQTNWDFLTERAQLYGYQMYADGRQLMVTPMETPRSLIPVELKVGENLSRFEPRLVSMGQATKTSVTGWDPEKQMGVKSFSAMSKPKTTTGELMTGSATAMMAFGKAEDNFVPEKTVRSVGEATTIAKARFDDIQSQFVKASGEVKPGAPNLVAGSMGVVIGAGTRFSGTYYITEARHIWRQGEYSVQFQATGRNPYTIRHLLLGEEANKPEKINGVVLAKVTSNLDPQNLGRVKVKFPWMPSSLTDVESSWARLAAPGAGGDQGLLFTPEVNDEVLVAFENGDLNSPYVVGGLWSKLNKPPNGKGVVVAAGKVNQRVVRSRSGHVVILDDTQGKEQIIIEDKTGNNSIVIDSKTNAMTIKTMGDLTLDAGGKLTITSKGDFSIKSQTKGAIEANTGANIKAGGSQLDLQTASAALKSTSIDVQANAQVSVKGNAMVQVQGGMVKIN